MTRWPFLFSLLLLGATCRAQDPFHRTYSIEDGLPSNQVYCALEDHEGFMWFGTDAGVSRFDGVEFMNLSSIDGLSDNEIIGIHEDSAHRIWFLTLNGSLCYWKDGRVHNSRSILDLELATGNAGWTGFCEDQAGRIWFSGVRGELLRLDLDGNDDLFIPADGHVRSVIRDRSGAILTLDGGHVERFNGRTFEVLTTRPISRIVSAVQQPVEGSDPVFLTDSAVHSFSTNGVQVVPDTRGQVDPGSHRSCKQDTEGNLWLYRKDGGIDLLARKDGGFDERVRYFEKVKVNTVVIGRNGDQWICSANRGVFLVDPWLGRNTKWYPTDRNTQEAFITMAKERDRIWIGTDHGAILSFRNGELEESFPAGGQELSGRVLRIFSNGRDTSWFGSDNGLFRWTASAPDDLRNVPFRYPGHGSVSLAAKTVLGSDLGEVWTAGNGLAKVKGKEGGLYREWVFPDRLAKERIYSLHIDPRGTLWMETGSKLIAMRNEQLEEFALPRSKSSSRITDIVDWALDTLAISTAGNGVLLWSQGHVVLSIGIKEGLVSNVVRRLKVHGDTLWTASASGVAAVVIQAGRVRDTWSLTGSRGLPSNNIFDLLLADGKLFLATDVGLLVCPPETFVLERKVPRLHLAQVAVNDSLIAPFSGILKVGTFDRVRVKVHALEYAFAKEVEYVYSLDNDGGWFRCERGEVALDQLEEGQHTLRVKARLHHGPWSDAITVPIDVRAMWWASRIAKAIGIMGLLSACFVALNYRSRRGFRRKLAMLHEQAVVNEERQRIAADVHDDLGADLSQVLMQARQMEKRDAVPGEERISSAVLATINKIDEIIWSLDPKKDTVQSTVQFVEKEARELAEAHGLRFRTDVRIPEEDIVLAANQRRELMLIAREALRNVVNHARASTVRVDWYRTPASITMAIEDDGVGMELSGLDGTRHGLQNMKERASRLGSHLHIRRVEPSGTRLEVEILILKNHPIG